MNGFILIVIIILATLACKAPSNLSSGLERDRSEQHFVDSLRVLVKAYNLSEELTKNDELLIVIYAHRDSLTLDPPLLNEKVSIGAVHEEKFFQREVAGDLKHDVIIFLIEQDSDTPFEQIDAILRIHHAKVIKAFQDRSYTEIEKYLGDEDLLGVKIIKDFTTSIPADLIFRGTYRMDRYEYLLRMEENETE